MNKFGKPCAVKGFGKWFGRLCREAGLESGLSGHGLRKLGVVRCVEAGTTELMALFGWMTTKQARSKRERSTARGWRRGRLHYWRRGKAESVARLAGFRRETRPPYGAAELALFPW